MSALDECIAIADAVEGEEQHTGVALNARAELAALRATVAEQARQLEQARNWHPIGFARDPLASRGWGTLVEAVSGNAITFEELVSRYNALLLSANAPAPQADRYLTSDELHAICAEAKQSEARADAIIAQAEQEQPS